MYLFSYVLYCKIDLGMEILHMMKGYKKVIFLNLLYLG